jgi:hypothetical protein
VAQVLALEHLTYLQERPHASLVAHIISRTARLQQRLSVAQPSTPPITALLTPRAHALSYFLPHGSNACQIIWPNGIKGHKTEYVYTYMLATCGRIFTLLLFLKLLTRILCRIQAWRRTSEWGRRDIECRWEGKWNGPGWRQLLAIKIVIAQNLIVLVLTYWNESV